MSNDSSDADLWKFQHPVAELSCGLLAAQVDTARPELGLHQLRLQSQPISGGLFSLKSGRSPAWPAVLADAYVRGNDLVATYEPTSDWPFAPQLYWRAERMSAGHGALAVLSLLVSIQTNLLDTHPLIRVTTQLPADDVLQLTTDSNGNISAVPVNNEQQTVRPESPTSGLLWRLPGGPFSYAEFAVSNDFRQFVVDRDDDGTCRSDWELFAEFLEKGVIRRARLHAAFLPRENDVELAAELCRSLASRALPLTT